jgi:hypothetical protein
MAKRRTIDRRVAAEGGLTGAAARIRVLMRREDLTDVRQGHPDLWEALESVVDCINRLHPERPHPLQGTFETYLTRLPPTRP